MAYHFSANQFEDQYSPRKLGNWEYPKWYPERPRQRFKPTKFIADNNGCLLKGVKGENPWGNYVGTWDLPRRITREYVKKLVAPPERLVKRWAKKKTEETQPEPETSEPPDKEKTSTYSTEEKVSTKERTPSKESVSSKEKASSREAVPSKETLLSREKLPSKEKIPSKETISSKEKVPSKDRVYKEETDYLPTIDHNCNSSAEKSFQKRNKSSSALDLRPRSTELQPLVSLQQNREKLQDVKPGVLDEKIKNILESVREKQDKSVPTPPEIVCKEIKAFPRSWRRNVSASHLCDDPRGDEKENYDFSNTLDDRGKLWEVEDKQIDLTGLEQQGEGKPNMEKPPGSKRLEPLKNGYTGHQVAKRFHEENLKHKPLPDVIDDPVFKALNSAKQAYPGVALNVDPGPSAIGWKPYSAPRPTECSKLKVFRPKTGAEKPKHVKDSRPKTGDSGYKKRFLPIDLAICWDLKPEDPSDEPKRSPHIDGSNGSAAPAVFSMIYPTEHEEVEPNVPGSAQALVQRIPKGVEEDNAVTLPSQTNGKVRSPMPVNKEAILSCIKSSRDDSPKQNTPGSLNSISPNAAEYARKNPKTAWSREDTSKALSDRLQHLQKENEKNRLKENSSSRCSSESSFKKKHHQSTPNLAMVCDGSHCGTEKSSSGSAKSGSKNRNCGSETSDENRFGALGKNSCEKNSKNGQKKRNCSACKKSTSDCAETREKPEFKAAFKAGVPRSDSTNSGSSSAAKSYKVPKMRLPYAKRSYSIGTLAPPFSLWRESNGKDYPEHWRLASVYQHSYKPIDFRKRPLLASVYQ